jgi:heterodisulfide reductase subunit A
MERLWKKMERLGVKKDRLQLLWASAAEGEKVAAKIREMLGTLNELSPQEVAKSREAFARS